MEEEIKKEKGEIFMFFADMKGAFDRITREIIWKIMDQKKITNTLKERIKEIYNDTAFKVKIYDKTSEKIYTKDGVRQGCPLSTALFNLAFSDLEETMKKVQTGGIVIGKKKVWTTSYADDVVLMSGNEEGLKEMIKRFGKFISVRGLELNTDKSKRKKNWRKKKENAIYMERRDARRNKRIQLLRIYSEE